MTCLIVVIVIVALLSGLCGLSMALMQWVDLMTQIEREPFGE